MEYIAGQPTRAVAHDYRIWLRERLQARRDIGCLTHHRLLLRRTFSDQVSHHHQAGVDTHPGGQRLARRRM